MGEGPMGEGWIPAQPEKPEREVRKQLPDSMVTTVIRFLRLPLLLSLLLCGCKPFVLEPVPDWAYPTNPAPPSGQAAPVAPQGPFHIETSKLSFTRPELTNLFAAPDWRPEDHPALPEIVSHGRKPEVRDCAYCHLPTGNGRPENARLAGLPVEYFVAQMKAFRDGTRTSFVVGRAPTINMTNTAKAIQDEEILAAARYFAALPPRSFVRVVESSLIPKSKIAGWLFKFDRQGGQEPTDHRRAGGFRPIRTQGSCHAIHRVCTGRKHRFGETSGRDLGRAKGARVFQLPRAGLSRQGRGTQPGRPFSDIGGSSAL